MHPSKQGSETPAAGVRQLRSLPKLPNSSICLKVVEGGVRSLLLSSLMVFPSFAAPARALQPAAVVTPRNEAPPAGAESRLADLAGSRSPDPERIARMIRRHLAAVSPWRESEIVVRPADGLKKIELPPGDVELRVPSDFSPSNYGRMIVPVEAALDGRTVRVFWVDVDVKVRAEIVRVAAGIPYHGIVHESDLETGVFEVRDGHADYVRSPEEAAGMLARRTLSTGDLLDRRWLEKQDLVHSGEMIELRAKAGAILLRTLGRALQNGKLGDRIRVRNVDSKRTVTALVTGRGEASVVH